MWFFKQKTLPKQSETYSEEKFREWTMRWVDLDARVTVLELADKEYKKRARRTFTADSGTENSNSGVLIPE